MVKPAPRMIVPIVIGVNWVMPRHSDDAGPIGHDDVLALPLDVETGLLQCPNGIQMIYAR